MTNILLATVTNHYVGALKIALSCAFATLVFLGHHVSAAPIVPGSFSTTWDTSTSGADGESLSNQVAFTLGSTGFDTCSGVLYWEEIGNASNNGTSTLDSNCNTETITFPTESNYRVDISGTFPMFRTDDRRKLLTVEQWGNNVWTILDQMFDGMENLTAVGSDAPNLSVVTDLSGLFRDATNFNSAINHWDVSNITDMSGMFANAVAFNQDLSSWDVSNVTDMGAYGETHCDGGDGMFKGATAFNQDISGWDVSNVAYLCEMFFGATNFDQDLSAWDVSNVTNMSYLFDDTNLSTQHYSNILNSWAALPAVQSNVTLGANNSVYFDTAATARQHLIDTDSWTITDAGPYVEPSADTFITVWDTRLDASTANELRIHVGGSPQHFSIDWGDGVSQYYPSYSGDFISHIYSTPGIKTVTITGTFPQFDANCGNFVEANKLIDVAQWGTTQWSNLNFDGCTHLVDFSASDTPDLSAIYDMSYMFFGATVFNGNIKNWDVSGVVSMSTMFYGATAFNQQLDSWNISNVVDMGDMLMGTALTEAKYTKLLNSWSQLTVQPDVYFGTDAKYCGATAQAARDILTSAPNNWVITDGGATVDCVIEVDEETETETENGTGNSGGSSGTRVGDRIKSYFATSSTPVAATVSSFIDSVRNFLDYLTRNEADLDNLSPEESTKIIISLQAILNFLLILLPGL